MSQPPPLNLATKPTRSVSFLNHTTTATVNSTNNDTDTDDNSVKNTTGRIGRSSFSPGRRQGYVRKGPVQSDSEADEEEEEEKQQTNKDNEGNDDTSHAGVNGNGLNANVDLNGMNSKPFSHTHINKAALRPGQNYVRKAPVNSDSESDTDEDKGHAQGKAPISPQRAQKKVVHVHDESGNESEQGKNIDGLIRPFAHARISGPGQNYVRKAPVNSDTESDEEEADRLPSSKTMASAALNDDIKASNGSGALGAQTPADPSSIRSRVSSHENSFLGVTGAQSFAPSFSPASSTALPGAAPDYKSMMMPGSSITSPATTMGILATAYGPGTDMTMNNSSNTNLANSSSSGTTAPAAGLASSMAIYQQQQQEMMLIMQQQQIQIATMQQQQQAYQLLVLQRQQQDQHQLQAVQQQHRSQEASSTGSLTQNTANGDDDDDDDDDDVPLGEKQHQFPQQSDLPVLPQLPSLSFLSSPLLQQPSLLTAPLSVPVHPNSPLQHSPLQHSRQPSSSSINFGSSATAASTLHQPHLANFAEEDYELFQQSQQHLQTGPSNLSGGAPLLASGFPAGYRGSVGSVYLNHLKHDRGSVTSLHSSGSNGSGSSNNGGASGYGSGSKPSASRSSLLPQHLQQQIMMQPATQFSAGVSMPGTSPASQGQYQQQPPTLFQYHEFQQQQQQLYQHAQPTLIHVEAKPPPPQTGLVGAITAMERDKKLAKAQGTNQLQYQHQQHQQQMLLTAEKERWLQEQRRMAWEAGQMPQQQQQQLMLQQQQLQMQFQMQQQQQQQLYPQYQYQQQQQYPGLGPSQIHPQSWTVQDEEDDNRPLGGT
ncbi:hypothetical protein BG011_000890 [Mortierella polycephala]|uniref:Uncharacterized protein n=1 Tax=Mortierella polycephala TaxID=41804 RepID=A0A9P6PLW2_9FUNG|nr:hypothetical protein BG011_000890 [Mortierella polycephala]